MSIYFHQYASWICGETGVPGAKPGPSVSLSNISVRLGFGLLRGVRVFGIDFSCSDEIHGFPQSFDQVGFLLCSQGELERPIR